MSSDDIERRVCECFSNVFPALSAEQLRTLHQQEIPDWDSVIHVTLLASLAEEFSIEVDFEAAQDMTSLPAAVQLVRSALGS